MYYCTGCGKEYEPDAIENSEGEQIVFDCGSCESANSIELLDDEGEDDADTV